MAEDFFSLCLSAMSLVYFLGRESRFGQPITHFACIIPRYMFYVQVWITATIGTWTTQLQNLIISPGFVRELKLWLHHQVDKVAWQNQRCIFLGSGNLKIPNPEPYSQKKCILGDLESCQFSGILWLFLNKIFKKVDSNKI